MMRSRLAKIQGRVRCQGFAGIKIGQVLELSGVGNRFNGKHFVSAVRHQLDRKNWETDIRFGLSPKWFSRHEDIVDATAAGLLPGVKGLQVAVVTALEGDPDGEDRIQVRLPIVSADDDGIWARIATLDAGADRGSFFRPEIEDEVVVGFLNEDPRDAVILGMVNSSSKPAPLPGSDDNHEKGFVTRSGMKMIFNDDKVSFTLETPGGNKLTVSDDEGSIVLEDQNGNKIEMTSDGITLDSAKDIILKAAGDVKVDGVNVEIKASAEMKAEGSAGTELSSSATTKVKGSLVQIN
jgi:Rhs element Vgr protein